MSIQLGIEPTQCVDVYDSQQIDDLCNEIDDYGVDIVFDYFEEYTEDMIIQMLETILDSVQTLAQALLEAAQDMAPGTSITDTEIFRRLYGDSQITILNDRYELADGNKVQGVNRGRILENNTVFDIRINGYAILNGTSSNGDDVSGSYLVAHELSHNLTWQDYDYVSEFDDPQDAWDYSNLFGSRAGSYCYETATLRAGCAWEREEATADAVVSWAYGGFRPDGSNLRVDLVEASVDRFMRDMISEILRRR